MAEKNLFDSWPEKYDRWFQTPIGQLVFEFEHQVVLECLIPGPEEKILDAGCGTGLFTHEFLKAGAMVTGLELSLPMLASACRKMDGERFLPVQGDMLRLPFVDECFDKAVSVTALEFIENAASAVAELFRVIKPGGTVVVATLNSLSPWAERRQAKTLRGEKHILETAYFRTPQEIAALMPLGCSIKTAVHFKKDEDPVLARQIERLGQSAQLDTGAFVVNSWRKPEV